MIHYITLDFSEATDDQLFAAWEEARREKDGCEKQHKFMHAWDPRIEALEAEMTKRRGRIVYRGPVEQGDA